MAGSPLVVGVDMSEEACAALTAALQLARRLGTDVIIVHAVGLLEEGGYRPAPELDDVVAAARVAAQLSMCVTSPSRSFARTGRPPMCSFGWRPGWAPRWWSSVVAAPAALPARWDR